MSSVVALAMLAVPSSAVAQVAVSGDKDSNAPLVIEPQGPGVRQTAWTSGGDVAAIQRMPVTKLVRGWCWATSPRVRDVARPRVSI